MSNTPNSEDTVDRKSTRLNSSHLGLSDAVFCLKKKRALGQRTTRQGNLSHSTKCQRLRRLYQSTGHRDRPPRPLGRLPPLPHFFFFFFNYSGAPEVFPFSPPGSFPV